MSPETGLFHFGAAYRPVPLTQTFIGVSGAKGASGTKGVNKVQQEKTLMTEIAYEKALAALRNGKQVMVFVHARNETVRTLWRLEQ